MTRFFISFSLVAQVVQLIQMLGKSNSYVIDQKNLLGRARGISHLYSSPPKNNEENLMPKKKASTDCPPGVRCPDYPSFAYDDSSSYGRRRKTRRVSVGPKRKRGTNIVEPSSSKPGSETALNILENLLPLELDFIISGVRDSNRRTRLLNRRSYTAREPFEQKNMYEPPCLQDLKPPPSSYLEAIWISVPFRIFSFAVPYYSFPYLIGFLDNYVTMQPDQLADITSKFGPGKTTSRVVLTFFLFEDANSSYFPFYSF